MSTYRKRLGTLRTSPTALRAEAVDAVTPARAPRERAGMGACTVCSCAAFAGGYLDTICAFCGHHSGEHKD